MRKQVAMVMILSFIFVFSLGIALMQHEAGAQQGTMQPQATQPEPVQEEAVPEVPGFTIGRMVVSESVTDLEPVGAADSFSADVEKVYCFIEALDITGDTTVNIVWYFGVNEMAKVPLSLKEGGRWRTYSSKNLGGLKGDWKVEVQDENGNSVQSVDFKVE